MCIDGRNQLNRDIEIRQKQKQFEKEQKDNEAK
jgi:hypothetical protein